MSDASMSAVVFETRDGARITADLYPGGTHTAVLAHGKVFDKSSWADLAASLMAEGYTVLAPDFRGYGLSKGPAAKDGYALDVAAATAYARARGAKKVSLIGGSMGAIAAGEAVISGAVRGLAALILLSPRQISAPAGLHAGHTVFVVSAAEDCAEAVRAMHAAAAAPKSLHVYDGDRHAQHLFKGPDGAHLTALIQRTLADV